jgi:prepilin-type N-terminal cleavage/methylation domain-containing protein
MNIDKQRNASGHRMPRAFTLVELLVVIGILTILLSILLPAISKARAEGLNIKCESNLHQVGIALLTYADSNGFLFPTNMGYDPAHVNPYPDTGDSHTVYTTWPIEIWGVWNPPVLLCPVDTDAGDMPAAQHSYVLNSHMGYWNVKFSTGLPDHRSSSDVVLMGEKISTIYDYYMEYGDFDRVVAQFHHGIKLGANYLMLDMHVDMIPPNVAKDALDPWDFANGKPPPKNPASQPSGNTGT